jgi:hypothetical protein
MVKYYHTTYYYSHARFERNSYHKVTSKLSLAIGIPGCCGLIKRTPKEETSKIKERGCSNDRPTEEKIHSGV